MRERRSFMAPTGLRAEGAAEKYRPPAWFGRSDLIEYAKSVEPPIRAEVASRAFGLLVSNADDLGLEVRCGFMNCRGRFCRAPHWVATEGFLELPAESILAAYGCGGSLAQILAGFSKSLING